MKHAMFVLVAACAAMLFGCREGNPVGSPAQRVESSTEPASSNRLSKAKPASDDVIEFRSTVTHNSGESFAVEGRVKYTLTQRPILREDIFDLTLDTQAKINQVGKNGNSWRVGGRTMQAVDLTGRTSAQVDEWYFIQGGPSSMYLHLQFSVTATNVSLVGVTIE